MTKTVLSQMTYEFWGAGGTESGFREDLIN
jgi:hypothetical protein